MSERSRLRDTDVWPDNPKEWVVSLLLIGGFLLTLLAVIMVPTVFGTIGQGLWGLISPGADPGDSLDDPVVLPAEHAEYLNRNYRESSHMQAYCGLLTEDRALYPWRADIDRSSSTSISFSITNCPLDDYPEWAVLLTHPNGNPAPTDQGRQALAGTRAAYLCIQSGQITTNANQRTEHIRCYHRDADAPNGLREIPVRTAGAA